MQDLNRFHRCAFERRHQRTNRGTQVADDRIHEAIGRLKERYPRVARYYQLAYDKQNYPAERISSASKRPNPLDGSGIDFISVNPGRKKHGLWTPAGP
jgi:hypothetical protein